MTNDILLDTDIEFSNGVLNEAYDRVSQNGAMPDPSEYGLNSGETGREIDDPFSNDIPYSNGSYYEDGSDTAFSYDGNEENITSDSFDENEQEQSDEKLSLFQLINSKHVSFDKLKRTIMAPFLFVVSASIIVTTFNRIVETDLTNIAKRTKEIENTNGLSILLSNELARFCKESEVAERVETQALGIHALKEPPQYFLVNKYNRPDSLKDESELFLKHRKQLHQQQVATSR